jgi:hypothetical protein
MHGGMSSGPRTAAGLERSRQARWRHGARSREVRELLADNRRRWRELRALLGAVQGESFAPFRVFPSQASQLLTKL